MKLFIAQVVSLLCVSLIAAPASAASLWDKITAERDAKGVLQSLKIKGSSQASFQNYVHGYLARARSLTAQQESLARVMASVDLHQPNQAALKASAIHALNTTDLAKVEANPKFQKLVKKLGVRFDQVFFQQDTVAMLGDSSFFFRATWEKDLTEWALSAIQLAGLDNTAVNVIVYLFEEAVDDLFVRRAFYQNYALHYLTTSSPGEIGLTDSEVSLILSSIYEARIEFYDLPASQRARAGWPNFGNISLKQDGATCVQRLSDHRDSYASVGAPFDHIFVPATTDEGSWIINLRDGMAFGNTQPSLAFDKENPRDIRNVRIALEVFLFALNLAPIPGPVQTAVSWVVHTTYIPQIESEGALMAYFQLAGDSSSAKIVLDQSVNPWLLAD